MSKFSGAFSFKDPASQLAAQTALGLGSLAYVSSLAFSNLTSHPTTLAGYGITDSITLQGNTFNGNSQLVQLDSSSHYPANNGSAITALNGTNVTSGTVALARLPATLVNTNVSSTFTANQSFAGVTATSYNGTGFSVDASGNLTAHSLASTAFSADSSGNVSGKTGTFLNSGSANGLGVPFFVNGQGYLGSGLLLAQSNSQTVTTALNSSATASRVISLPDASGTLLLSNGSAASLTSIPGGNITTGTVAVTALSTSGASNGSVPTFNGTAWTLVTPSTTSIINKVGAITAVSGNVSGTLDFIPTTGGAIARYTMYAFVVSNNSNLWYLDTGTDANSSLTQRPADYNASTNTVVWRRFL